MSFIRVQALRLSCVLCGTYINIAKLHRNAVQHIKSKMDVLSLGAHRLFHLDLKGAPPKLNYLEKIFPLVKDLGVTGILLEWEDTFPYMGELLPIGSLSSSGQDTGTPYSTEEAREIINLAAGHELEVIPLVQVFGHMEFVLKHPQWSNLREVEAYPSSICPSHHGTLSLVYGMLKQMIAFHPSIGSIHIGADEVWHMGLCPVCTKRMDSHKYGKIGLYLDYVSAVARHIKQNSPNLNIIIWDDMLRNVDAHVLQEYGLGSLVEPMVWHYNSAETFQLGPALWEKYCNIFPYVWAASAFKGATASSQVIPINKHHISNHEAWLGEIRTHGGKFLHFKGIALTGWSRYDHYATLCELLPTAIPSLCLCLKTWLSGGYSSELHKSVAKMLGYRENMTQTKNLAGSQFNFPGWQILVGFEWFVGLRTRYKNIVDSDQMRSWFNQWQVLNNYTNPMQVNAILPVISDVLNEVILAEEYLKRHLEQIYYSHTIEELLETLIAPVKQHLTRLQSDCVTQLQLGCHVKPRKTRDDK